MWYSFIYSSTFWLVLLALSIFGYGIIRATPLRKLPIFNKRKTLMWVSVAGLLIVSGWLGSFGLGSLSPVSASDWSVTNLQVTTAFNDTSNGTSIVTENSNVDDLIDVRATDEQVSETTSGDFELGNGVVMVTRTGGLGADSCTVRCVVPPKFEDESAPTGQVYGILEEDNIGTPECYLNAASSSTAAATTSPKEVTSLAFDEGVAIGYVGVALEVEETGHDALDQYSYKDVVVDVCGKPFTFRVHRMDA